MVLGWVSNRVFYETNFTSFKKDIMVIHYTLALATQAQDLVSQTDPVEWITPENLTTVGGATLSIVLVVKTINILFGNIGRKLLLIAFILCVGISATIIFEINKNVDQSLLLKTSLTFFNGLLLFTTSVGTNETLSKLADNADNQPSVLLLEKSKFPKAKKQLWSSWLG